MYKYYWCVIITNIINVELKIFGLHPQKLQINFSFSPDNVREVDEERKSPTKEQSSSSCLSSEDPSPFPVTDDASTCSPAADSPRHDVLHYMPDYSEPILNGLPSENVHVNTRLCTLL